MPPLKSSLSCPAACVFFFQAEDGIRDKLVTGVQTCALPISARGPRPGIGRARVLLADDRSPLPRALQGGGGRRPAVPHQAPALIRRGLPARLPGGDGGESRVPHRVSHLGRGDGARPADYARALLTTRARPARG